MMPQAGENIQNFALRRQGVAYAVGGQQRKMQTAREFNRDLVAAFFFNGKVTLQFDVNILAAENGAQLLQTFPCAISSASAECIRKRAFVSTGKTNQSAARAFQFFCFNSALAFCSTK